MSWAAVLVLAVVRVLVDPFEHNHELRPSRPEHEHEQDPITSAIWIAITSEEKDNPVWFLLLLSSAVRVPSSELEAA